MKWLLLAIAATGVLATVLPLLRVGAWWVRVCDFPRVQVAVALAVAGAGFALYWRPGDLYGTALLAAVAACLAYQGYRIFPYTPFAAPQVVAATERDPGQRIRILIANVLMTNRRADDLLALVRGHDPDLVLAVETDAWWGERLEALAADYPHAIRRPQDDTYGMHLFSRLELRDAEVRTLVEDDVPSVRAAVRLPAGAWIDFYGVHPRPPRPGDDSDTRDAELLLVGRELKAAGRPAIVAGDLNDVAWSHTNRLFQRISGTLDPRIGRGIFGTFHARYPVLRWPLDHVFFDASFALGRIAVLPAFGSDHLPVLAELYHQPAARARQDAPAADGDDREEATEKIRDGHEEAAEKRAD